MKPIVPIPRKASGFSIASIMGQDDTDKQTPGSSEDSDSGDETQRMPAKLPDESHRQSIASRLPPLHPALPAHVKHLLLSGSDVGGDSNPELQAKRTQAWAFGSQHLGAFPALGVNNFGLPAQFAQQGMPGFGPAGPTLHPGLVAATRDPLSMYPWMLNRPPASMLGLPYGHPDSGFFFHPYRKPKRIRTAFSPTQLLKLEHAFEKNHYVVGQERKDLASKLNLTETQVKVWFQNRRTKHKRVRSDDEADGDNENISIDDECTATSSYNDDVTDDVTEHEEEICPQ